MSSTFDKNLLPEFDSVKDNDEEILWTGKPKFIPYIFSGLGEGLFTIAFGIVWVLFTYNIRPDDVESGSGWWNYFWLIGLIPLLQGLYVFLNRLLSFSNTAYGYSNKRVMMRTGFIGTDFKIIDYDKISDIEVNVNIIERMYNVGSIRFFSGRTQTDEDNTTKLYDVWSAIENPYEVFKMVKQTSVDIKTDFNYPNALRPDTNPGYKTKYDRKD
jgi:membrane protein YdbS with pleckstrin-like domain